MEECPVCFEQPLLCCQFSPCAHRMCAFCLSQYTQDTCPVCRAKIDNVAPDRTSTTQRIEEAGGVDDFLGLLVAGLRREQPIRRAPEANLDWWQGPEPELGFVPPPWFRPNFGADRDRAPRRRLAVNPEVPPPRQLLDGHFLSNPQEPRHQLSAAIVYKHIVETLAAMVACCLLFIAVYLLFMFISIALSATYLRCRELEPLTCTADTLGAFDAKLVHYLFDAPVCTFAEVFFVPFFEK